jgi:hypothetical protein
MCSVSGEFVRGGQICVGVQDVPNGLIEKVVNGILQIIMPVIFASSKRNARRSLATNFVIFISV